LPAGQGARAKPFDVAARDERSPLICSAAWAASIIWVRAFTGRGANGAQTALPIAREEREPSTGARSARSTSALGAA